MTLNPMRAGLSLSLVKNRMDSVPSSRCHGFAPEPCQPPEKSEASWVHGLFRTRGFLGKGLDKPPRIADRPRQYLPQTSFRHM